MIAPKFICTLVLGKPPETNRPVLSLWRMDDDRTQVFVSGEGFVDCEEYHVHHGAPPNGWDHSIWAVTVTLANLHDAGYAGRIQLAVHGEVGVERFKAATRWVNSVLPMPAETSDCSDLW